MDNGAHGSSRSRYPAQDLPDLGGGAHLCPAMKRATPHPKKISPGLAIVVDLLVNRRAYRAAVVRPPPRCRPSCSDMRSMRRRH
jgi:hypothetical protein